MKQFVECVCLEGLRMWEIFIGGSRRLSWARVLLVRAEGRRMRGWHTLQCAPKQLVVGRLPSSIVSSSWRSRTPPTGWRARENFVTIKPSAYSLSLRSQFLGRQFLSFPGGGLPPHRTLSMRVRAARIWYYTLLQFSALDPGIRVSEKQQTPPKLRMTLSTQTNATKT
jgi:hypothetical protein